MKPRSSSVSGAMAASARRAALPEGFVFLPDYLDAGAQAALLADVLDAVAHAPFYEPRMPRSGTPFGKRMTNLGPLGWWSDIQGYRYVSHHPLTGEPWPAIPDRLLDIWRDLATYPAPPECCLVNYYDHPRARLGLHVDHDEEALAAPVVSLSLGDTARFRIGGPRRSDPSMSVRLPSGAAVVLAGASRLCHHGIDGLEWGSSRLIPTGGRINLTLRRVRAPQA